MRLLLEGDSGPAKGVALSTPFAVLGREDCCDLTLDRAEVSRRHTYLQLLGGRLWFFDLLSRTGTWCGGRRQAVGCVAASGFRVGPVQLRSLDQAPSSDSLSIPSPLLALAAEEDAAPTATLEFMNAAFVDRTCQQPSWQLDRPITFVGSASHCKVRFKCPSVSRIHCSLVRTPRGVWLVDLLGRTPVLVNGAPTRWARLNDGDRLTVGRFEIQIRAQARRSAATAAPAEPTPVLTATGEPSASWSLPAASPMHGPNQPAATTPGLGAAGPLAAVSTGPSPSSALLNFASGPLDSTQALLLTFMNQFSGMQQQMFDQFQQTTLMMLQMFGTMQREQFDLLRQELQGLRELNQQIQTLQSELDKHRPRSNAALPASATAPASKPDPLPRPAAPWPDAPAKPAPATQSSPPKKTADTKTQPASRTASTPTPAPETVPAGEDVHAWLSQRFNELQEERQSRWQKIVGTLLGKP